MAGNNQYSIELNAVLNEKSIDTQLKSIANKYSINLTVNVQDKGLSETKKKIDDIQKTVNQRISGKVIDLNTEKDLVGLDKLQKKIDQIKKTSNTGASISIASNNVNGIDKPYRAILTYTNEVGRTVREKWIPALKEVNGKLVETGQFVKVQTSYVDNIAKATKQRLQEEKKVNTELEKAVHYADKFLERTKGLNKSANVNKAAGIAGQIQQLGVDPKNISQVRALRSELEVLDAGIKQSGTSAWSWQKQIGVAIDRTIQWAASMGLVYGALRQLRDGIQYVSDLNKILTDTQIVTDMDSGQIDNLAVEYNNLAREMGATTKQVAEGALEFQRQGKTVEETTALLKNSMMLSKLANIESAQSTEYVTSIMNGFRMEVGEVGSALDKLIALDNNFATSSAEVAAALQRSSSSAAQVGVTYDELASYITVVSSVTRKSAESIGESYKTMFARMSAIKLGQMFEDDATTINDVEKALSLVNVKLRDSENSFRPLGDVMDDIADKWDTMNELEQSAVSGAIAGKTNARTHSNMWGNASKKYSNCIDKY